MALLAEEVSGFSVQVSVFCLSSLTPDTRHLEIWCLEFDIFQCSITPPLQRTAQKGERLLNSPQGRLKAGSFSPGFLALTF